ncbi:protein FAM43A [Macrotis lagotis]|uniref:protein FAM43A n=1 Tax=Macrotis lagotis TaxID=92651 RepID=UPI003D68351A
MLPWKRSKVELIAEDPGRAAKAKGYAGSLRYSALTSLARACPESALARVGSMFRSRRKKVQISREAPSYGVLYLGNASTLQARGEGCTDLAVGKIWAKSQAGRQGTKMRLSISAQGVRLVPADGAAPPRPGHLYLLHRVTCGAAAPRLPRVFAWVYRHELKHKAVMLRCHAVLASRAAQAQAMALLLYQTSAAALAEFKRLKRRDDARHQQRPAGGPGAPPPPLRRLLRPGPGCYKPPVERSRGAPKLGPITEDPLGEQREQQGPEPPSPDAGGREQDWERARAWDLDRDQDEPALDGDTDADADTDTDTDTDTDGPSDPGRPELSGLLGQLGQLSIGHDARSLRADLRLTRRLSGESTGSESSVESGCRDSGGSPGLANGLEDAGPEPGPG